MEKCSSSVSIKKNMAEINTGIKPNTGSRRSKKLSTRVDLTPMVDLGFLLITFFVFTTSMKAPTGLPLHMPDDRSVTIPTNVGESTAFTVIPLSNGQVFYYHGSIAKAQQQKAYGTTSFSFENGIGFIIRTKQKLLDNSTVFNRSDLMLLIKPSSQASLLSFVNAMDEVLLNDLKHYAIVELDESDKQLLKEAGLKE
jgi:Biopolymer transport protein ExbD/TolR